MADRRLPRRRRSTIVQPGKAGLQSAESAPLDNRSEPGQLALEGDRPRVDARCRYCPQQRFGRQLLQAELHVYPLVDDPGEDARKIEQEMQLPAKRGSVAESLYTCVQGLLEQPRIYNQVTTKDT